MSGLLVDIFNDTGIQIEVGSMVGYFKNKLKNEQESVSAARVKILCKAQKGTLPHL